MQENQLRIIDENNMSYETGNNRLTLFDHLGNEVGYKSLPIPIDKNMSNEDLAHYCKESGYDLVDMMDAIITDAISEGRYDIWLREDFFLYISPTTAAFTYEPYVGVFAKLRELLVDTMKKEQASSDVVETVESQQVDAFIDTKDDVVEAQVQESVQEVVVAPQEVVVAPEETVSHREAQVVQSEGYTMETAEKGDDLLSALGGVTDFGSTDFSSGIVSDAEPTVPTEESVQKFYDATEEATEDVVDLSKERAEGEIVEPSFVDAKDDEETIHETVVATPSVLLAGNAPTPKQETPPSPAKKQVVIEMPVENEVTPVANHQAVEGNKQRVDEWKSSYAKVLIEKKKVDGVSSLELRSHAVEYILKNDGSVFDVTEASVKLHLVETMDVVFDLNDVVRAAFYEAYMLENVQ